MYIQSTNSLLFLLSGQLIQRLEPPTLSGQLQGFEHSCLVSSTLLGSQPFLLAAPNSIKSCYHDSRFYCLISSWSNSSLGNRFSNSRLIYLLLKCFVSVEHFADIAS